MILATRLAAVGFLITATVCGQRFRPTALRQIAAILTEKCAEEYGTTQDGFAFVHAANILRVRQFSLSRHPQAKSGLCGLDSKNRIRVDVLASVTSDLLSFVRVMLIGGRI